MERTTRFGTGSGDGELGERMGELEELAVERLEELRARAAEAGLQVSSFVRQRPVTAILIAAGLGYVLGRSLRS